VTCFFLITCESSIAAQMTSDLSDSTSCLTLSYHLHRPGASGCDDHDLRHVQLRQH
jgi:hypothetical protein